MNKILLWIIGAVVVAGGGFLVLYNNGAAPSDNVPVKGDDAVMEKTDDTVIKDEGVMMEKGSYETYAPEKLAKASSGDVVLFFRASWCPTCKAVDADIRANLTAIPGGLTILDVDYDNSSSLKQKYGVTYQHTFVQVRADGTLIKKWSGSPTLAVLVAEVQ